MRGILGERRLRRAASGLSRGLIDLEGAELGFGARGSLLVGRNFGNFRRTIRFF